MPETNLLDAQGIDPQAAALIEPYAISAHAVRRAAVVPGEQVLVVERDRLSAQRRLPKPMVRRWW